MSGPWCIIVGLDWTQSNYDGQMCWAAMVGVQGRVAERAPDYLPHLCGDGFAQVRCVFRGLSRQKMQHAIGQVFWRRAKPGCIPASCATRCSGRCCIFRQSCPIACAMRRRSWCACTTGGVPSTCASSSSSPSASESPRISWPPPLGFACPGGQAAALPESCPPARPHFGLNGLKFQTCGPQPGCEHVVGISHIFSRAREQYVVNVTDVGDGRAVAKGAWDS